MAKNRRETKPKSRKCPECGVPMRYNPKHFSFECPNPNCSIIEIRLHRDGEEVRRSGC